MSQHQQYKIKDYSYKKAKELGVEIKPSTNKNKKIDVIKKGKVIASIGDINYKDYPTYIQEKGLSYAKERRRLYNIRHKNDKELTKKYSKILW
jgi:hypothetical protein